MSPEAEIDPEEQRVADLTEKAIADPNIETGFDPEVIGALLRERGLSETTISTVERPEGFRVGFDASGNVVEIGG